MKAKLLTILFLICFSGMLFAQERTGRIQSVRGEMIEFATVVFLEDERQAAVALTDTLGNFTVSIAPGEYTMKIHNIAYQAFEQKINIVELSSELGIFEMEESEFQLNEVVVTASPITYEDNHFVMRVNNSPSMLNKNVTEVLQLAPGVWIDDNGISINGTSGTKVFINEQEVRLSQDELVNYLRNFHSSNIARVEIIPQAGAEYSADSSGGVIKIILRKQQENGMMGNVMLNTFNGKYLGAYRPSATVNSRMGKWTLNALLSGHIANRDKYEQTADREYYDNNDSYFHSQSDMNRKPRSINARVGVIYELDTRNNWGAEVEFSSFNSRTPSTAETVIQENGITQNTISDYLRKEKDRNFAATFNYVHQLDTIGSTLKLIADYTNKHVKGTNDSYSTLQWQDQISDSIYHDNTKSNYEIYSADLMLNKQFQNGIKFSVGAKYMRNNMSDSVRYESFYLSNWKPLDDYNFSLDYTENIGALYGKTVTDFGRLNLTAGLRGEYTHTKGRDNTVRKHYFDLFPSVNATYSFDAMRMFMLIAQYSRSIQRPNFWYLNPNRIQYSDYSYMVGNPQLRPTYINSFGLTAVYKYRYILSIGGNLHKDLIREVTKTDPINSDVTYVIPENHHSENHYYISLSFPLKFTNWWNLNANLVGVKQDIRGTKDAEKKSHYLYFSNLTSNFTLPAKIHFEIAYSGTSRLYSANSGINPSHLFHVSIKKQFLNEKLTATLGVQNIFNAKSSFFSDNEGFRINTKGYGSDNSRHIKLSIQYNFNAGKSFKKREIEASSNEEKNRMKKMNRN